MQHLEHERIGARRATTPDRPAPRALPTRLASTLVAVLFTALSAALFAGTGSVASASETVQVSDVYMPYQVVGYSVGHHSNHKLRIDVAVDFGSDIDKKLPVTLRAELIVGRARAVAVHEAELGDMAQVTKKGELEANGRRWKFDDLFSWEFFCEGADRSLTASSKDGPVSIGDEEVEFLIRVGVLEAPPSEAEAQAGVTRTYLPDSVYQTPKRIRLVCGDLTPLPR